MIKTVIKQHLATGEKYFKIFSLPGQGREGKKKTGISFSFLSYTKLLILFKINHPFSKGIPLNGVGR